MAETKEPDTKDTKAAGSSKTPEKTEVEVNAPNSKVVINTAEDAAMAFLHGQITEDELKDMAAKFGVLPGELMLAPDRLERPDDAFENTLPDDIYKPNREKLPDYKERLEAADDKQKERDEATERADKEAAKEVQKVQVVPAGASTSPSAAAQNEVNTKTATTQSKESK